MENAGVGAGDGELLDEAAALLRLQRIRGIGDARIGRLLERFGSGRNALAAKRSDFTAAADEAAEKARGDAVVARRIEEGLTWCRETGVQVAPRGAASYPSSLLELADPPAVIFLRGDATLLTRTAVAVVGSRRATHYGRRVARDVACAVVTAGGVVASGLALGIDGEAHRAALAAGGKTFAVLGAGPDRVHPRSHATLFRELVLAGLLVSEFLPGEPPLPHHFPRRNRVLAALSQAVVVVQAARRSGALITADHALDLGRDVFAVPGSIYASTSRGAHELLAQGAHPILTPETVLDYVPELTRSRPGAPSPPPPMLAGDAGRVFEVLDAVACHVDEIAKRARIEAGPALAALSFLELDGHVRREPGMHFARARASA